MVIGVTEHPPELSGSGLIGLMKRLPIRIVKLSRAGGYGQPEDPGVLIPRPLLHPQTELILGEKQEIAHTARRSLRQLFLNRHGLAADLRAQVHLRRETVVDRYR